MVSILISSSIAWPLLKGCYFDLPVVTKNMFIGYSSSVTHSLAKLEAFTYTDWNHSSIFYCIQPHRYELSRQSF